MKTQDELPLVLVERIHSKNLDCVLLSLLPGQKKKVHESKNMAKDIFTVSQENELSFS